MTVRVTTLKGDDAGAYYTDGLGRYYLDGGEPPGRWWGTGAEIEFGLAGDVDPEVFLELMAGRDPGSGRRLGRAYGERSVRGYDVTFSAPKSVSVLWAVADPAMRAEVAAAHDRAVEAVLGYVESHAHVRPSIAGQVVVVDGRGLSVARFRQHTSRTLDPQLHTHAVIVAKVRAPSGGWYALDARGLKCDQRTLSALYHAGLRAELTRRLGVEWRDPVNGIAEMAGVPDEILERFSKRTNQVEHRLQDKLDRFRDTLGREPTARERWRLEREAIVDSRPAKPKGAGAAELHGRWRDELADAGVRPERLVDWVTGRDPARPLDGDDRADMVEVALLDLADRQSSWRPAELVGAIARSTPTATTLSAGEVVALAEALAGAVTAGRLVDLAPTPDPAVPVRADGRPITESVLDHRVTLPAILDQEADLVAWAKRRWNQPGHPVRLTGAGVEHLDRGQRAVAAAVAGTAQLVCVVGPAGAGKTTALRPAVQALRLQQRPVFGVAASATAAAVLQAETGMPADTIDKLLWEHRQPNRPAAEPWRLPAGTTLLVDEASMVGTAPLAALAALADLRRWRVILVGDPHQLSAVGRSGMFAHLCDTGPLVELDRIHRFHAAWERAASQRLRRGDPEVLDLYQRHGRIGGGTRIDIERAAVAHWWAAHRAGERALIVAATNDAARRLNHTIQQARLAAGELGLEYLATVDGVRFHVGDRVVTRRNDRQLRTDRGVMVRNRAEWTIQAVDQNARTLMARGVDGTVVLPADYIAAHLDLGYAQTIHAAQGRTVDHSILVADTAIDSRSLYVAMTRGRHSNHALVATDSNRTAVDILSDAITRDWDDTPAIRTREQLSAREQADLDIIAAAWRTRMARPDHLARELGLATERDASVADDFGVDL